MCGLAGIIDWRGADTALVAAMTDALKHRGPDAAGFWSNGPAALGHRRLSIIDLSHRADQPMADAAGRYQLIFNGEIYNYRALRPLLEQHGYRFHTESDTEVLLNAFIHWGADCLERLNGMFAFAIWDAAEQRLTLARDRLGEKPLYFLRLDSGIVFASELKALRLHPAISREIDARALGQYLSLNYTLGNRCMVPGVEKLEPGHVLTYARGEGVRIRDYWNLAQAFRNKRAFGRVAVAEGELRRNIEEAVSLRLVSDVPLGAFLSGGIDSATIVNAMRASRSGSDVKTFSIGFTERSYSELPEARQTAAHLGTDHRDKLAHWDLVEALPRIVRAADEPFADNSIIPTYFLSQFARQNVTVSLSGDGGDEIFGGYETYRANQLHAGLNAVLGRFAGPAHAIVSRGASLIPATFNKVGLDDKLRRFAAGLPLSAEDAHFSWRTVFDESEKASLLHPDVYAATEGESGIDEFRRHFQAVDGCHYLDRAMYVDIKTWLPHDILHKVDRASMAHSLEVRAPYLDHHLVEFAASLPVSLKVKGRATKYLLRRSQRRALPRSITDGRKRGFNAPMAHWLLGDLKEMTRDVIFGSALKKYVRSEAVEALWQRHEARRADNSYKLFGLLSLGLWLEQPVAPAQ
jgi:asparagine synthase (glutamine-hydrolysing)